MRIAFVGNCCNNNYVFIKGLRKKGIDAHLFLHWSEINNFYSLPESEDSFLKNNYPEWIHIISAKKYEKYIYAYHINKYWKNKISKFDIIHTHSIYTPNFINLDIPYVVQPFGGDFFISTYKLNSLKRYFTPWCWLSPYKIRLGIKRASVVILTFYHTLWSKGYRLLDNTLIAFLPLSIDIENFSYGYKSKNIFQDKWSEFDFFIFQATRQVWKKETVEQFGGNKGNDVLIKAFSKFCKIKPKALLVLVNKGQDKEASKQLISELDIESNVKWIESVPREKLKEYLYSCDITVDSLNTIYGSLGMEAMACGVPLLMNLKYGKYKELLGELPPCIHVESEEDIFEQLVYLYSNRRKLLDISILQRKFLEKFHDMNKVSNNLLDLYNDILNNTKKFLFYKSKEVYMSNKLLKN